MVRFFNNQPDDYVLAYPYKQKNNIPYTAEEQSCLCQSLLTVESGVLLC